MNEVKVVVLIAALLGAVGLIGWFVLREMGDYCQTPAGMADDGCRGI